MAIRKERENLLYCCMKVGWRLFKKIRSYLSYIKFYVNKPSLQEGNNIPNITVSFTTYPAREKWLPVVVGSLLRQKLQPDRIVLYLSFLIAIPSSFFIDTIHLQSNYISSFSQIYDYSYLA